MTTNQVEDIWTKILQTRPRLRNHTSWHKHIYRNKLWYLLEDKATNNHYYINEIGYNFLRLLDGSTTVEQVLNILPQDQPISQQEILELLAQLQKADLLALDTPLSANQLYKKWQKKTKENTIKKLLKPIAIQIPLFNPIKVLDRLLPFVKPYFKLRVFFIWLAIVIFAGILGLKNAQGLGHHASTFFLDPHNLFLLWLAYPLIKGLHEFGHAIAIRVWGGSVQEMGIMLLVFVPVPYVNANSATAFSEKHKRIIVSAIGIMIELFTSALALFIWISVVPGIVRDIAFVVMVIGGISTLLFNGNPLIRFDGYYVLVDLLEIPNLGLRSQQYYIYLGKKYLLGIKNAITPVVTNSEKLWFVLYGFGSYLYRLFISFAIAMYLSGKFFTIGVILAIWVIGSLLIIPIYKLLKYLLFGVGKQKFGRALILILASITILLVVFFVVPVPHYTVAQGVILAPESSIIRAHASGEVIEILHTNGEILKQEEPVIKLQDNDLIAQQKILKAQEQELTAIKESKLLIDRTDAAISQERLEEIQSELNEVNQRISDLTIISPSKGYLELLNIKDLLGKYIEKGTIVGFIKNNDLPLVRAVIPQSDVEKVRHDLNGVLIAHPLKLNKKIQAKLKAQVPSGINQLPSASLGTFGGGHIVVDPRDKNGLTAIDPVFQFDISLNEKYDFVPGKIVQLRFKHTSQTLAARIYTAIRQLFLNRFAV